MMADYSYNQVTPGTDRSIQKNRSGQGVYRR